MSSHHEERPYEDQNTLYPVFLKVRSLQVLIVGGGNVAEEKLHFLLKSSPDANVTMIPPFYRKTTIPLASQPQVTMLEGKYHKKLLKGKHIVIATTDVPKVNVRVYKHCRKRNKLVNVADNPPYCD